MTAAAELFAAVMEKPAAHALAGGVAKGGVLSCVGVARHAQPFVVALLKRLFPDRAIVAVTDNPKAQDSFHQDLQTWLSVEQSEPAAPKTCVEKQPSSETASAARCLFYPEWGILPSDTRLPDVDTISERLETLVAASAHRRGQTPAPVVVTTAVALLQRTFAPAALVSSLRLLRVGEEIDPRELVEWLQAQAYEPEVQVSQKGEMAMRGGIVDVFPLTCSWPVRLEFLGNAVESIRFFDPATQVSFEKTNEIWLAPAGELGILRRLAARQSDNEQTNAKARGSDQSPSASGKLGTLVDYMAPQSLLVFREPDRLEESASVFMSQASAHDPLLIGWNDLMTQIDKAGAIRVSVSETGSPESLVLEEFKGEFGADAFGGAEVNMGLESLEPFCPLIERAPEPLVAGARRRQFFAQLHRWLRQKLRVHVFCNNEGERDRFVEIWRECGFATRQADAAGGKTDSPEQESVEEEPHLHLGALSGGFLASDSRFVVVTDAEVVGRYKIQRPRRLRSRRGAAAGRSIEVDFTNLEPGDYVVHLQCGIGRFVGLRSLSPPPRKKDDLSEPTSGEECLVIEYAPRQEGQPSPLLHVPATQAHLVTKYIGAGKARPQLDRLGGNRWLKVKAAATDAVQDLAADLLAVQAARDAEAGFAFPPDVPWQREFESAFVYEETPDQMHAIEETKQDMSRPRPMDRLVCGDAGFGKTEVAIRAAFKAVLAGKQVAVLVPTTVLAQQHFNTFSERMADYPLRIELLSRFRGQRDQQRVLRDLGSGAVDIVIGTHRLVQPDVVFKDLGLVVIDEEQRFGVSHKEQLKRLRRLVDVLTLSATPIPRTLYLALAGARDMSSIETPPHDRLPVETIIAPYDERLIRDAIRRELGRGGQVFYLHNRIHDIEAAARRLAGLVPEARIGIGHGQMHSDSLERTMTRFVNGEIDVLLSTTIVESGIDIPNANTILIDRADRFGLSDLYQLRGRVGRYKNQAYAYLLIPRHAALLADARKRISAIKQFSKPGSGFRIALRDLEIRGAGNLLGPEQSGHINAIGFELYCHLLKRSIAALKGQAIKPRSEVRMHFDFLNFAPTALSDGPPAAPVKRLQTKRMTNLDIEVPREVATWTSSVETVYEPAAEPSRPVCRAAAVLPLEYVTEARHRLEFYRKLAQATERAEIDALRDELRDRFGPPPAAVELLLLVTLLRQLAARCGVSSIETRGDRLMLTREGEYIMVDGKFPRLSRRSPKARLNEIRKLLLTLVGSGAGT